MTKHEKDLLSFLQKYPNQWHSYARDPKTLRAIGGLLMYRGLGVRGLKVSHNTGQMRFDDDTPGVSCSNMREFDAL